MTVSQDAGLFFFLQYINKPLAVVTLLCGCYSFPKKNVKDGVTARINFRKLTLGELSQF